MENRNQAALAKIEKANKGQTIVFVRAEEVEEVSKTEQYVIDVTEITFTKDDFAPMGGGKYYPLKQAQNAISEGCGIDYNDNCGTRFVGNWDNVKIVESVKGYRVIGQFTIIGWAQGMRRKPDGTFRTSSKCEYEFNPVDMVNADIINAMTKMKWVNSKKVPDEAERKILSYEEILIKLKDIKTHSLRRAAVGAQLAVVRELAKIPTGFNKEDTEKPMLFSQIIESNDYKHRMRQALVSTPEGRKEAVQAMFGTKEAIYGKEPEKKVLPEETKPAEAKEPVEDFGKFPEMESDPESDERQMLNDSILDFMASDFWKNIQPAYFQTRTRKQIEETCHAATKDSTIKIDMLRNMVDYFSKLKEKVEGQL